MDFTRKLGIGIVMMVPTFVGGGAVWSIFGSWPVVFIWIAIMALTYRVILTGKFSQG
jgi:hypothetical protein